MSALAPDAQLVPAAEQIRRAAEQIPRLIGARRRGAVITALGLGAVMTGGDSPYPSPRALTRQQPANHWLGIWPGVAIRSDYTPVGDAGARVAAAAGDRGAWGRTLHVFHPESACFAQVLAAARES